jgi:solute carrier family 6 amino acid transporter-like protein 5/7/9/14
VLAVVCLGVVNGASSIGILNKILMPLPFLVLLAFFIRAVTLPGAGHGIGLLFVPDVTRLADPRCARTGTHS